MPRHTPATADLLLELLELAARRPISTADAQRATRRSLGASRRRVDAALRALKTEGLIAVGNGNRMHPTAAGFTALERAGRDQGDATIVFTDIVDSTQLIDSHGEHGAHALRQRHFALLELITAEYGGRVVKNLGDGLMLEFAEPADAVRCAAELQRSVAEDADQLGLRVGVHTGPLLREGDDLFGTTVIVARRLCDRAESGQTFISDVTREATTGARPSTVRALGPLSLKGLSQPVAAFAVA